jgi:hypothetical protein
MLAVQIHPEVEARLYEMYDRYSVVYKMAVVGGIAVSEPLEFGQWINHLIARGMILENITYDEIEKGLTYVKD